jgi:RCC1 and BTB domain-containing protein
MLGTGTNVDIEFRPHLVAGTLSNVRVVHISFGNTNTLAVAETGQMFSWGLNDSGQLGLGHMTSQSTPMLIEDNIAQEPLDPAL